MLGEKMANFQFSMTNKFSIFNFQKSGRKITRILILLGIREGYLLVRNVFGIVEHPKLTMSRIVRKRDLSQGILIFGLPIGLWFGWIFVLLVSRLFIFGRLQFGFLAKVSFLTLSLLTSSCVFLIVFYFFTVWRKGGKEK